MTSPPDAAGSDTPIEEARGQHVVLRFEAKRCIHARRCVLGAPDAFVAHAKGSWLRPDAAGPDELVAIARSCPSGALTYERLDGGRPEAAPLVNTATVRENGPLAIHADLELTGHGTMFRATLCRCGASKNKPFCDGSHVAKGFTATGEPETQPSEPLAVRGGKLTVMPIMDGPLIVRGSVEVCSGTGRTVLHTQKTAFCRCGGSSNKPFCDGTHASIGFESE
jgi:CDGSH-type Zn-finger protein/uncharacterized Fe-S cluster protein YjdI